MVTTMDVLPLDVCKLIVKKLNPIARIRLANASRLWRQITTQFEDEEKPQMFPWVMMLHEDTPLFPSALLLPSDSQAQEFLSIEDGYATLKLKFPHITTSPGAIPEYRCNKKGWKVWQIVTVGEQNLSPRHITTHPWLINHLACIKIELPILSQVAPEDLAPCSFRRLFSIKKVVFSTDPCATDCVVAAWGHCGTIHFCRLGELTWTTYEEEIMDMVFHKGRFFGYHVYKERFVVFEYDHLHRRVSSMRYHVSSPVGGNGYAMYMLESCGEVLLVLKQRANGHWQTVTHDHSRLQSSFQVFKLDSSNFKWVRLDSLGDTILFVGCHGCLSVSAKDFPTMNLKGNCIYFISYFRTCENCIDFGVYHLEDGRVEPLFPSGTHLHNAKSPLFWL